MSRWSIYHEVHPDEPEVSREEFERLKSLDKESALQEAVDENDEFNGIKEWKDRYPVYTYKRAFMQLMGPYYHVRSWPHRHLESGRGGTIYLLSRDQNTHKLGFTRRKVDERIGEIQPNCPDRLQVTATMSKVVQYHEKKIHDEMEGYHLHSEWFDVPRGVVLRKMRNRWPDKPMVVRCENGQTKIAV